MAAGDGTRLRPLTERWAKPVLPIDGRPVLATLLRELAAAGFQEVTIVTGYLAERRWDRRFSSAVGAMLTGNVVIYLFGLPWLAVVLNTNLEKTLEYGLYPFVPGDTFKLYLAAAALPGAWRLIGRLNR